MKCFLLTLLSPIFLVALFNNLARGQSLSPLDYYPLDKGNLWIYKCHSIVLGQGDETVYYTVSVAGDTLMPNGKLYKIIQAQAYTSPTNLYVLPTYPYYLTYERLDSVDASSYRYDHNSGDRLLDKLNSSSGDYSGARLGYARVEKTFTDTILGVATTVKYFQGPVLPTGTSWYRLAYGLGLISSYRDYSNASGAGFDAYLADLVYANIRGATFGGIPTSMRIHGQHPLIFTLNQNYPNPFNATTSISFHLPFRSKILISVHTILGTEISKLVERTLDAGNYSVSWNSLTSPSGVYFCRFQSEGFSSTLKMILLK